LTGLASPEPAAVLHIEGFFDEATNSVSYLIADSATRAAAVIDAVLDFDLASGKVSTASADRILASAEQQQLDVHWILETHVHADHLSAGAYLKHRTGARTAVGKGIVEVQRTFAPIVGAEGMAPDAREFDRLLDDGDRLELGSLEIEVMATPGHTPACVTYRVGDAAFVGDTLFMPDYGTARCDFPGGDARTLYRSMHKILSLPPETRLFMCHDYKAPGREAFAWETTVAEQRERNVHLGGGVAEDAYVAMREARDATLKIPKLLYPAIQVNMRGGRLPREVDGRRFIKLPVDAPDGFAD
jgi:glyoxylase-like metal-dependent hydrolase (beta-lactamase superfamily II)